ncbi:unnamed protein product [Ceutorhynchus assimilis]|uniref:Ion transport domain-containing protein n=1 Tax=Ceutorhynchus assimilis TaxID=467358 RepID=A0A9N9QGK7_9CUCU|nr:unnamed protein product [Ceutorhynchus assimilis]
MSELNGQIPKFNRTSSKICATPEEELLEAVLNNNTIKIQQLINKNESLISYTYPDYGKRILLIACSEEAVQAKTVEKLLNLRANPRDHTEDDGWEALHWAAQKTDFGTLDVLIRKNSGDINAADQYGSNALQILVRHGKKDSPDFLKCAELLIKKGIDYNHVDNKQKTALQWAERKGVGDDIKNIIENAGNARTQLPQQQMNNNLDNDKIGGRLQQYLLRGDEDSFINSHGGNIREIVDYCGEDGSTLLQTGCSKMLNRAVKHLLDNGADPNLIGSKNSTKPILIAAEHGSSEIMKDLLEKYDKIQNIPKGVLGTILKYIDREYHDNKGCYRVFMDKIKNGDLDEVSLKLNEIDDNNNTPIHFAIRYADQDIIEELLSLGASLGPKNRYGVMPIQDLQPETLEKHLDNCVTFNMKSKKIDKEDFQVKFNYRSLIPPYAKSAHAYEDCEAIDLQGRIEKELVAETEVIFFMSKSSEFKHLLKHPVIVSFLFMKWLRIQWLFWANLAFYVTFALSLVVYIFSDYAYFNPEEKSNIHVIFSKLSFAILVLTLLILVIRELFQISVAPLKYFKNFENYIEIILIVITSMMVLIKSPSDDTRKQLSSLSILLAAFELVLMLGQHPYFSTNVVMLRTVSFNFFKFLIWYSLLIIAFALSFYLLFTTHTQPLTSIELKNDTDSEDNDKSFENPGRSVFKTIIMLTGEFDASDLNFETFPVVSKLIFVLFIFMIAIILLNLLNGLAVSDTQMIKNDAELVGHIARAEHIRYVESMLLGNILPSNIVHKLRGICCCLPRSHNRELKVGKLFAVDACLFPKYLNYELTFYPNKYGLIEPGSKDQKIIKRGCAPCAAIYLDKDTVRRTNNIVHAKRDEANQNGDDHIKKLELELLKLQDKMDGIYHILKSLNNSSVE